MEDQLEIVLLPEQFNDLVHRSSERRPEQRLMLAILEDALYCWLGVPALGGCQGENHIQACQRWTTVKQMRLHREANRWIFEDDPKAPLSFAAVCAALCLDPDFIRARLLVRAIAPATARAGGTTK